jgi:tRNA-dihydrouridine synthase A
MAMNTHRLCIAPMMDRTDRHFRYLARLLAPRARLYTEMLTARALTHGNAERLLEFDAAEHPVALQLGGAQPRELAAAARLGAERGYDEINLNVGCPSDRVQAGCFGAALMLQPALVADCVRAMREAVSVPVTVKTRLGVDEQDSYEFVRRFVEHVAAAGCGTLVVHARKAWLNGLSPKENREIPPLDYARVYRLKREFPELAVILNGGLVDVDGALASLAHLDGVMLGRAAYRTPWLVAELDGRVHGTAPVASHSVLERFVDYVERELGRGTPLKAMTRHLAGLYAGRAGGRRWRRELGELPQGAAGFRGLVRLAAARAREAAWSGPQTGKRAVSVELAFTCS